MDPVKPDVASFRTFVRSYSRGSHAEMESRLPYKQFQRMIHNFQLEDIPEHKEMIDQLVQKFKENWGRGLGSESLIEDTFVRGQLRNVVFVGHVNTDLDSIAGAISGADLFRGLAARSEEKMNGEIEYALKYIGLAPPEEFEKIPGAAEPDEKGKLRRVCLVDHNEVDQMTPTLKYDPKRAKRIVGLIDHHALAPSFATGTPLFMDVRPWGSMSSILFHTYLRNRVPISMPIARLLLCAILSDTLNLKSGTTTSADRFAVAILQSLGEVEDVDELAMALFTAKTDWIVHLGAYEMIRGDQKNFVVGAVRMSIAVLEVTAMEPVFEVVEDLLAQLRVFKYEKGDYVDDETEEKKHDVSKEVHVAMLFVVDTLNQRSVALINGNREKWLMKRAFPDATFRKAAEDVRSPSLRVKPQETLCDVGKLCSRKLDFLPRLTAALQNEIPGWFTSSTDSEDGKRLRKLMESGTVNPLVHTSTQVIWDKNLIKAAVFDTPASLLSWCC